LERASAIDVVCLDKTGTLTAGTPALVGEVSDDVLRIAASVEQASEHPIARAVVATAKAKGLSLSLATNVIVEPGGGISAIVEGKAIKVGSETFVVPGDSYAKTRRTRNGEEPDPLSVSRPSRFRVKDSASGSEVIVSVDDVVIGALLVADPPSPTARATIDKLRAMSIEPVMITGDREAAARWIAHEVGIDKIHFAVKPTGKARIVVEQRTGGHRVAMVGDGINDAPALAAADVGIALGSGADLAAAAADITILRGGIATLPTALGLARATLHAIRRNLGAAFIYNLVCIPIAAAGLASPMVASAAMSLSSVTVLLSSLRLKQWQMR
jgi:P-type Cu+ transporter